jgi:hypothetical protein
LTAYFLIGQIFFILKEQQSHCQEGILSGRKHDPIQQIKNPVAFLCFCVISFKELAVLNIVRANFTVQQFKKTVLYRVGPGSSVLLY